MKKAFTLIELLVVIVILVVVMAVVAPEGSKMLNSFETRLKKIEDNQKLSKDRSSAFLQAEEKDLDISGKNYSISSKGVLTIYEKSDDNN